MRGTALESFMCNIGGRIEMSSHVVAGVARVGLWLLLAVALAGFAFIQMIVMTGAVRDGWQARDLGRLLGVLILGLLVFAAARKTRSAWNAIEGLVDPNHRWRIGLSTVAVATGAAALLVLTLGYLGQREVADSASVTDSIRPQESESQVIVSVTRSPCVGCRPEHFDQEAATNRKDELADMFLSSMTKGVRDSGQDPAQLDLKVVSDLEVTEFKGRQMVVVHLAIPGVSRAAVAAGLVGEETVQVQCVATSTSVFPLESADCRRTLDEAFPAGG